MRIRVKKHLGLLAFLAMEAREPQRRDLLTEVFWPRAPFTEGRHSLATAVSEIRGILGPAAIESTRDAIRLACSWLTTDLERLEAGNVLGTEVEPPLELGDLLQDLELPDATGYLHWRDRLRARWRPAIQAALLQLLDRARRNGDGRELDRLADRLFELEDLNEQGIRAKMEAAAFAGNRVAALKIYETWVARLHTELSAVPSPVMQRFADDLRRGGSTPGRANPARTPSPAPAPLIARATEYSALYGVWEGAQERKSRHALVRGESGVGKTTLVSHLLTAAALEGAIVARVHCYEVERDIPFAALASLVRSLIHQPGAAATTPEALADLAEVIPSVRERFPSLPAGMQAQGESARLRVTESMYRLIATVAEERPIVVAVDDFHLADDVSLAVLHLVLRRLEEERVMIVFSGGGEEAARSPNAIRLLEATASLGVQVIEVLPLNEEASDEVLNAALRESRPDPATRRAMLRAARGYPLVLNYLAQEWSEHGISGGPLQLQEMTPDVAALAPGTIHATIIDRVLQRLDTESRLVLNLAAVLAGRMNELRFYSLLGLSSAQTVSALSLLVDHRVLRDGEAGLEFVNDVVRAHIYIRLPSTVRRKFHSLVADELLLRNRDRGGECGLELAWHLIRCGRTTEFSTCLIRGAREAIDHGAAWEAERALNSSEGTLSGSEAISGQLLHAEALFEQGRDGEARRGALSVDCSKSIWATQIADAIAISALARMPEQPLDDAQECFDALVTLVREAAVPRAQSIAARGAAIFALKLGQPSNAEALLDATSKVDATGLSPIDRADMKYARATALYELRRLAESDEEAEQAIRELEGADLVNATLLSLYCGRGAICCARGNYAEAMPFLETAHQIARRIGNLTTARACLSNLALCCFRLGDTVNQIRWGEMLQRRAPEVPETFGEATYTYHLAIGYAARGDAQKAFDALAVGDAAASRLASPWARQSWLLCRADILATLGRQADAKRAAREAVGPEFGGLLSDSRAGPYARWKARVVRNRKEASEARMEVLSLLRRVERFDALDRVEILAAAYLLGQLTGDDAGEEVLALQRALSLLPEGAASTLRHLGFLDAIKPLGVAKRTHQRRRSAAKPTASQAARVPQPPSRTE